MMKKVLVLLLALFPLCIYAQTDVQLSQQLFSRINYNPAATGASNYINMYVMAREQWVGFKQAPSTQVFNAHSYFQGLRSGIGFSVSNDKIHLMNAINAKLSYAYHIHFNENSYLSLGLSGGILHRKYNASEAVPELPGDMTLASYIGHESQLSPDFDFGIEFNTKNFQIGVSTTHLNNVMKKVEKLNLLQASRHIYAYAKYSFDVDRQWRLVPTVMGINSQNTFSLELNGMAFFRERFWFGASYRFSEEAVSESLIGIVGLFITDFLRLGYSYDFGVGSMRKHSQGTHEIMLSLRLSKGDDNYGRKSPRFFE